MNDIIPIWKSHYSIGRSILTCDKAENEIVDNKPVSIFSLAKHHNLPEIYLMESSLTGFIEVVESAKDINIPLRFGYQVICCADIEDKSEKSFETEHKLTIWMKNSAAYSSLIKISSKASTDGFFYIPRIDYKNLKSLWSDDLLLTVNFYDGFIHKNLMTYKSRVVPDFGRIKPTFFIEPLHGLPFDDLITNATLEYCKNNNFEILNTHSIYYYKESDIKAYQVFRCINARTTLNKPNLSFMSSDKFAFETWIKNKNEFVT
jgi:DNA polymerase III alpha subunit